MKKLLVIVALTAMASAGSYTCVTKDVNGQCISWVYNP